LAAAFELVVLLATSPVAVTTCKEAAESISEASHANVTLLTWLDIA